jgi:hypothetical protein
VHRLLEDPWVAARIDEAVAPYVGRLPAAEIAWMRDQLAETLASDPAAAKLLHRARPPVIDESGKVEVGGAPSAPPTASVSAESVRPKAAG